MTRNVEKWVQLAGTLSILVPLCTGQTICPAATGSEPPCSAGVAVGKLCTHPPQTLCPTQYSLGMIVVSCKTDKFNGKSTSKLASYLETHPVPVVVGPDQKLFVTDHHHLAKALSLSKYSTTSVYVCPQLDLSSAGSMASFWESMNSKHLVWPENNEGKMLSSFSDIPATIADMSANDPYRSVSEYVRDDNGYIKCDCPGTGTQPPQCQPTCGNPPFLEFVWADVIRSNFPINGIYNMSTSDQIAALIKIWPNATKTVQQPQFAKQPHYNSGSVPPPNPPITVDPATGCEE